jgi:hypothetical protein
MELNPISQLAVSTAQMGQVLQQMTDAKMGLDDKMLQVKAAEIEQAGAIDVTA